MADQDVGSGPAEDASSEPQASLPQNDRGAPLASKQPQNKPLSNLPPQQPSNLPPQQPSMYNYPGGPGNSSYPPPYPMHYSPDPEEGVLSPSKAAALVTIGGALGLTAVAAVRWLNGGDFELFPPAAREAKEEAARLHFQAGQSRNQRQQSNGSDGGERFRQNGWQPPVAPNTISTPDAAENDRLYEHVQTLVEALHSNTQQQEKILQRISSKSDTDNGSITNQSMNLLRPRDDGSESSLAVFRKLAEVQAELSSLRRDFGGLRDTTTGVDSDRWEARLTETMEDLRKCLDRMEPQKSSTEIAATRETKTNGANKAVEVQEMTPEESSPSHRSYTDSTADSIAEESASSESSLADAIRQLTGEKDATALRVGSQLLYLYVVNLSNNPRAPRYRKIYTTNESFLKVDRLVGARELLTAVGFVEQGNCLEWLPSDSDSIGKEESYDEEKYLMRLKEAASVLSVLKSPPQGPDQDSESLALAALSALTPDRRIRAETPPPPAPPSSVMEPLQNAVPTTPEEGSILSPPATKKLLSVPEFPPLHPLTKFDDAVTSLSDPLSKFDDALTSHSDDSPTIDQPESQDDSPTIDQPESQDDDGIDAMWK
jgi:hypothetical protein